jgi:glycosyltransferase involved in cell wall biosynthesis
MHIRFLIMHAYGLGGTVRTTFTNAEALAARHHDVEIVSVHKRHDTAALPLPKGVRVRTLCDESPAGQQARGRDSKLSWQSWASHQPSRLIPKSERRYANFSLLTDFRLVRFLRSLSDGVLVSTRPGLNLLTARFARSGVVTVGQDHMHLSRYKQVMQAEIVKYYPRLDLVVSLTNDDAEDYRRSLGGGARVLSIPNSVPELGGHRAAGDTKIIVAAGRLTRQKGFDQLLPAFAKIADKHPDWQLRIFGGGQAYDALRSQLEGLGLVGRAHLLGFSSRLYEELAASAVYVMSSRFEGAPMVLLEAMGVGLPVISFDCPNGPRDLIEHGTNGLLVDAGDVDGLAAAMSTLMSDEPLRRSMGAAALQTASGYRAEATAERWESVFAGLTTDKR